MFRPIPGLISCAGVNPRRGLLAISYKKGSQVAGFVHEVGSLMSSFSLYSWSLIFKIVAINMSIKESKPSLHGHCMVE